MKTSPPPKRTRGRPPAVQTKARVLAAAESVFAAHGKDAASLQQIAEAAGVSKQTVLHHFGSKDGLHTAVLDAIATRWHAAFDTVQSALSTLDDAATQSVVDRGVAFFQAEPALTRLLLREMLDRPAETRAWLWKNAAPWAAMIQDLESRALAHGVPVKADPAATALSGTLMLSVLSAMFDGTTPESEPASANWKARLFSAASVMIHSPS